MAKKILRVGSYWAKVEYKESRNWSFMGNYFFLEKESLFIYWANLLNKFLSISWVSLTSSNREEVWFENYW